ncbi:uncharacterized protein LOC126697128 [Quercus robur]|uniref:uncharacterized protein LOC126697128 n=1 Tax=Quercus robur TaxID=38942 RepID=UPI0021627CF9|nr:uncharacterized protein LOC126697128 [Quercus robur]XP_050249943.1 uncharacterized protein LOC126697128 [Quercus robur]
MQRAPTLKRFHPSLYHLKTLTSTTTTTTTITTTTSMQRPFSTTTTSSSSSELPKIKHLAYTVLLLFGGAITYNSFSFPKHNKPHITQQLQQQQQQQQHPNNWDLKLKFNVFDHFFELKHFRDEQDWILLKTQIRSYSQELDSAKFWLKQILDKDLLCQNPHCICGDLIRKCLEVTDRLKDLSLQIEATMDLCAKNSDFQFYFLKDFKVMVAQFRHSKRVVFDALIYFQELEQQHHWSSK